MEAEAKKAIEVLLAKIDKDIKAEEALKYTQAALNAAHVAATFDSINKH